MITFRLADSLPAHAVAEIARTRSGQSKRQAHLEALLDAGHGACFLREPRIAALVQEALLYFDGARYFLLAWVVMPNHLHALIETTPGHSLSSIVQSWKSYMAKEANKLLGRTGTFWWPDYFDRAIRDRRHLTSAIEYIHNNPVKAGLAARPDAWPFSSASFSGPAVGTGRRPAVPTGPAATRQDGTKVR